jgi:hypothetical protein
MARNVSENLIKSEVLDVKKADGMNGLSGMAEWVMDKLLRKRDDFDVAREFVDNLDGTTARTYEEALIRRCTELWMCPFCGEQTQARTVVIAVHPYGLSMARETREQVYCPGCLYTLEP